MRRLHGWTLKVLAERLATTPQTIHRLETGTVSVSTDWLERFAKVFGVAPAELIGSAETRGTVELLGELGRNGQLRLESCWHEPFKLDVPAVRPVAVRVQEQIGPYPRGAILIGNRLEGPDLAAIRSCDALVAVDDATVLLRRLIPSGVGQFILVPFAADGDIHYDVVPRWVARLIMRVEYL